MTVENPHHPPEEQEPISSSLVTAINEFSHDLIGYLATLRMKTSMLQQLLPSLLKGYQRSVENNLMDAEIKDYLIQSMPEMMNSEVQIKAMIDALTTANHYCEQMVLSNQQEQVSLRDCVNALIKKNPAVLNGKSVIEFNESIDFKVNFSPILIKTLLERLMNYAAEEIDKEDFVKISIELSELADGCILYFNITANDLNTEDVESPFKHFFLHKNFVVAPDFGLFRLALRNTGGDLRCNFSDGQLVQFIVIFAK